MRLPVEELVDRYKDNVFRVALSVSRNPEDAEDVVQDTFITYMESDRQFENEEHIRRWLLRIAINKSKNIVMGFWYRNRMSLEDYLAETQFQDPEDRSVIESILSLPKANRIVIYLYYYEGYQVREMAEILRVSEGTVKSRLFRGRKMLKNILQEEEDHD